MRYPKWESEIKMATERKVYSEAQKAEIKRRRDEKNAALKTLIDLVVASKDLLITPEMTELAKLAMPKNGGGTGTKKTSMMNLVGALFIDKDVVDEIEVFNELKIGRSEMAKNIKLLIKNFKPEFRTWIRFEAEDGEYIVEGRGEETPLGWTGYIPVEEIVEASTDDDLDVADED